MACSGVSCGDQGVLHRVDEHPHLTDTGLSRFYGEGRGPSPEVETGHYDAIYRPYAEERKLDVRTFEDKFKAGEFTIPTLDKFFIHDRCVRESGHDTTYRWDWQGDRCADFVTVDLNSLLYKTEVDIARTIETIFGGMLKLEDGSEETSAAWYARAKSRKELITRLLWDNEAGMFFDYDFVNRKRHRVPQLDDLLSVVGKDCNGGTSGVAGPLCTPVTGDARRACRVVREVERGHLGEAASQAMGLPVRVGATSDDGLDWIVELWI